MNIDEADRRGFHRLERDGTGRPFCWSGYEDPAIVEIELDVPGDSEVNVRIDALAMPGEDVADQVDISLDGTALNDLAVERDEDRIVWRGRIRTPANGWPRRHHAIKLSCPRVLEPDNVEHRRMRGVAVHAVELSVAD